MKRTINKKGQAEEFFDDLIAFGLLALAIIVFALYLAGVKNAAEKPYDDTKQMLSCNEQLIQFLQGTTKVYPEKITRYELAMKITTDAKYEQWFIREAENYFDIQGGYYTLLVYPNPAYPISLQDPREALINAIVGTATNTKIECRAEAYLPLLESHILDKNNKREYIQIILKSV